MARDLKKILAAISSSPTDYVIRVSPNGWIMTPFSEDVVEHLEGKSAPEVSATKILELIAEKRVSLVEDPQEWGVTHMHGGDVTIQDLNSMGIYTL